VFFLCVEAVVTSIAGNGVATFVDATGSLAGFVEPVGLTIDPTGNVLVADFGNRLRKITPAGGASVTALVVRAHDVRMLCSLLTVESH
jgi:hypothetical protein